MPVTRYPHEQFLWACQQFARARKAFDELAIQKLVRGNDNHVGDIGEYWVARYYEQNGRDPSLAPSKISPYAFELSDGTKVSVRTITPWSKGKKSTQVKPPTARKWELAAVSLDDDFNLVRLAIVPSEDLFKHPPFKKLTETPTELRRSFPPFQWWPFLQDYEKPLDWLDSLPS